ncbi:MAG: E3 ubiquitin ligase family protein [Cyanobacteria bacterium P01_F01_bin.86]
MAIFGIILLIVGGVLFFVQRNQKQKLLSLKAARSVTVAELTDTAGAVADEIGGGSWRDYVKLWGEIVADSPLYSEHKQEACVHYVTKVVREFEEIATTRTEEGTKTERQRKSETVTDHRQSIPFGLRDRTGTVKVDPDSANIETISILDEFRPERSGKTLGYRYQESVLPVGRSVLVVGAASDLTGEVIIGKPVKSIHKYLISLKDEEHLAAITNRNAQAIFYGMFGCLGLGLLLLIVSILS